MSVDTYANGERSRREEVIARQRAFDEEQGELAKEEALLEDQEAASEQQERALAEKDAENQRTLTFLKLIDLRRKHISEAEFELNEENNTKPTLLRYMPVFVLAIAKDGIFDPIFFLPGLNFIITCLFGVTMFVALYLTKTNRSLFEMKRIATFLVGLIIGFMPIVALLPEQTTVVFLIFLIDRAESNEHIARAIQVIENIKKD